MDTPNIGTNDVRWKDFYKVGRNSKTSIPLLSSFGLYRRGIKSYGAGNPNYAIQVL